MSEITLDSFKKTLDSLIVSNPHARNKGDDFKAWAKEKFDCDARISYIKEQRQITNCVSEQFRYFAPIVIFVCVQEVKRDTLVRYILERVYKQLENVAIIGMSESQPGKFIYTFEKLITFKNTDFTEWATPTFAYVESASVLMDQLGIENEAYNDFEIDYAWFVGTTGSDENGNRPDLSEEYIDSGIWVNRSDKFGDIVNSIAVGDRIAIKSTFTQKNNLPFNNNGKTVSAMRIKAIGIVTENIQDGNNLKVEWERLEPFKNWYGPGSLREAIHRVESADGDLKRHLLAFTFGNEEQDFAICEDRYVDDKDVEIGTDESVGDFSQETNAVDESIRLTSGCNVLLYGVPGSGKSWTIEHEYCNADSKVERLLFYPDYTNADFVGQILPVVDKDKQVTYEFTAGPFTTILKDAYNNPSTEYILIIEEINRGNAPAIFGDIFQLLDRSVSEKVDEGIKYPKGTSEYCITNENVAEKVYGDRKHKVRIPSNLSILGTMNTSDQNVFTLDTAFQRRWRMRLIENNFDNVRSSLADVEILDTGVTWKHFCETINNIIIGNKAKMASAEDKRLGVYFIHEDDIIFDDNALPSSGYSTLIEEYNSLIKLETSVNISANQKDRLKEIRTAVMRIRLFPEKVIKYLWDDAFKFNLEALFDTDNMDSLEKVIRTFVYSKGIDRFKVFKQTVRDLLYTAREQ